MAIEAAFALSWKWDGSSRAEWVVLFDLCVFLPVLHLFAYRATLPRRVLMIRTVAIAGAGLWLARLLVPTDSRHILDWLAGAHGVFLAVAVLFELAVLALVLRALYGAGAERLTEDFGIPPWVARLMVLEARFWKTVLRLFRRRD